VEFDKAVFDNVVEFYKVAFDNFVVIDKVVFDSLVEFDTVDFGVVYYSVDFVVVGKDVEHRGALLLKHSPLVLTKRRNR
jgi:hypothetical protein